MAILVLLLTSLTIHPAAAQDVDSIFVPETGHWITGPFLAMYQSVLEPELVFGFPITDEFTGERGQPVQYFTNARMELTGSGVILTRISSILRTSGEPQNIDINPNFCRQDTGWDYPVCYSFLAFFEAHGGEAVFGKPVSHFEQHGERAMQHFENLRLEWNGNLPHGERVTVSQLGVVYFHIRHENVDYLKPSGSGIPLVVTDFQVRAFIAHPTVSPHGGLQSITVAVLDQNLLPLEGAEIIIEVHYPGGAVRQLALANTGSDGLSRAHFPIELLELGFVRVTVSADFLGETRTTETSFRIWH